MKRLFALLLATVMVVGLTACGSKTTPDADSQPGTEVSDDNPLGLAEKITISYSHVQSTSSATHRAMEDFGNYMNEKSNGWVTLEIFPAGQLYNDSTEIDAIVGGNIDMVSTYMSKLTSVDTATQYCLAPYLFDNVDEMEGFYTSEYALPLYEKINALGLKVVNVMFGGEQYFMSNGDSIRTIDGFKGKKVREGGGDMTKALYDALGASVTTVSFNELYTAMQTKMVDIAVTSIDSAVNIQLQETLKSVSAYDAAVIAAYPIWKGEDIGLSYHLGKIIECGCAVALPRESDGMIGVIDGDSFTVVPADPNKICKPDIVAAHTLYERTSPFTTEFPGGGLDMSGSSFSAEPDGRTVRVRGTKFVEPARLTLKLEGSRHTGFRCICLAGIRDPFVIANFAEIEKRLRTKVKRDLPQFEEDKDYKILFHRYGAGEIMKERDPETWTPKEIGLVIEVISPDQDTANTVCALCRSGILHQGFPGRRANSGNLAFLYTPAEFPAPPCYEFALYHLMVVDDLIKPFPITWVQK